MKILHIVSSLDPTAGGLAACVKALTPELMALGHDSEVATLDQPEAPFLSVFPGKVHALGPQRLGYGYSALLVPWLKSEAKRFDAVIVHGLWQFHGYAAYRALRGTGMPPYFVFPHGMLDPWFQRTYPLKHLKKLAYWWLAERRLLRAASLVLFTCEEERKLAGRSFGRAWSRESVVAFGTTGASGEPARQKSLFTEKCQVAQSSFWLFLGRIHPKKGVDLLIDAYSAVAKQIGAAAPGLVIAGPCADEAYLHSLKQRAAGSCPAGSVYWPGMLNGDVKWGALRSADVFLLPSHQENFGIAVAESMSCGTPVLISDKVNIWREIETDSAGLVEPDSVEGVTRLLHRWLAMESVEKTTMRSAAISSFLKRFEIRSAAQSLVDVLAGTAVRSRQN